VTVLQATSIADKLYARFSPFYDDLVKKGVAYYDHNKRFPVVPVPEDSLTSYALRPFAFDSEPSGWAAFLPLLFQVTPTLRISGTVLVVHTGNGIPFVYTEARK